MTMAERPRFRIWLGGGSSRSGRRRRHRGADDRGGIWCLWLIVAAFLSGRLPGRWRALQLLWLAMLALTLESLVLVSLLRLWIGSGFGLWMRRPFWQWAHYDCMQWYLRNLFRGATRVLRLRIVTVGPTPEAFPVTRCSSCPATPGRATPSRSSTTLMNTYDRAGSS